MTLSRIIETGRGKPRARIAIEGWPVQPVTHSDMAQVLADGRRRVLGLRLDGLKLAARLSLPTGKIDSEGFRCTLVDVSREEFMLRGFRARPTNRTWLFQYHDAITTTLTVFSTDGFPNSGVLHIGTEAIQYTSKTATQFLGCTRGYWGSQPQAHFTSGASAVAFESDAGLSYPPVTDSPESLEGRRVWLYLYGEGDSSIGDGVQRWQGAASTCPKVEGRKISFMVDPPTAILKQAIGGDVAKPVGIRGIYYPWNQPFSFEMRLHAAGASNSDHVTAVVIKVHGHFEDEAEFCAELTSKIDAEIAANPSWSWPPGSSITALPTSDPTGFRLRYVIGQPGAPRYISIVRLQVVVRMSVPDPRLIDTLKRFESLDQPMSNKWIHENGSINADPVNNLATYSFRWATTVPRAYFGTDSPNQLADPTGTLLTSPDLTNVWRNTRIYLGGLVAITTSTAIALDEEAPVFQRVYAVNPADNSIDVYGNTLISFGSPPMLPGFQVFDGSTRIRLGRVLAIGNVGTLLETLVATSADYANAGAMPLVRASDVDVTASATALSQNNVARALSSPAVNDRAFVSFGADLTLEDLIAPELVAAGLHWTMSHSGQLGARRARLAAPTEPSVHHIGVDRTQDSGKKPLGGAPTVEEAATWGFISDVAYLTEFDPIEDEHTGPEIRFVNVAARAPTRAAKRMEIAQKSIPAKRLFAGEAASLAHEPTQEDVGRIARLWLGLLGGNYDILTVRVPATLFDVKLGDAITLSSRYVPAEDGSLGVSGRLGICVGFSWDVETMTGSLELLLHSRPIAGYAPEFRVISQVNVVGNTWTLTLDVAEESDYPLTNWFFVPDIVRVTQWDATAPIEISGTVAGTVTATTITVDLNAAWVPGSSTWTLRPELSDNHDIGFNLGKFCYVANASARVQGDGHSGPARVFAP